MLINLLEADIVIHPYADREFLGVLTRDTRSRTLQTLSVMFDVFDGLVYEEDTRKLVHVVQDDLCVVAEGIIRTAIPIIGPPRVFRCGHRVLTPHIQGAHDRMVSIKINEKMVVVMEGIEKTSLPIIIDLGLELELKHAGKVTLWDHLQGENL